MTDPTLTAASSAVAVSANGDLDKAASRLASLESEAECNKPSAQYRNQMKRGRTNDHRTG